MYLLSVNDVGSVLLTSVDLLVGGVGHEAESARPEGTYRRNKLRHECNLLTRLRSSSYIRTN